MYLSNPLLRDSDGDGSDDFHEIAAGTDPNSATDIFKVVSADGSDTSIMRVRWNAKAGKTYQVVCSTNLNGPWENAPDGVDAEGASLRTVEADGVQTYLDPASPAPSTRFYRIQIAIP